MGIRAFIAAMVGGSVGFVQCIVIAALEEHRDERPLPAGDFSYTLFALGWFIELMALMAIAMYRISPWVARLLRDEWEANRILRNKKGRISTLEWACVIALLLRALGRFVESGEFTWSIPVGVAFGLIAFVIPLPDRKQSPTRNGADRVE